MAGVHRLHQRQHLVAAHLADHDAIWSEPQCGAHEVGEIDGAGAVDRRWTGFEADGMRVLQRQLRGVLDDHQSLRRIDVGHERGDERRLAGRGRPGHDQIASDVQQFAQQPHADVVGERTEWQDPSPESSDRQHRSVDGDRRQHRTHPGSVGESGIDDR